jgi:hypothetical protein
LLRELRAIADHKYVRALSLTNRMRRDCLRPRRSVARRTPAMPVLEAAAAIDS